MTEDMLSEREFDECPRCHQRGALQSEFRFNSLGAEIATIYCPYCGYRWTGLAWGHWGGDDRPDLEPVP